MGDKNPTELTGCVISFIDLYKLGKLFSLFFFPNLSHKYEG